HLVGSGYLDANGTVLSTFAPAEEDFELNVPSAVAPIRAQITDVISKFVFANRIINARKRQAVHYRKQVGLDPGFRELWERISKRTKYRVSLSSDELVDVAAKAIRDADPIEPAKVRV